MTYCAQQTAIHLKNPSLGNLTGPFDADSRIIGVGGSLAAVNLPPATSQNATYNGRNQHTNWNGVNVSNNNRGDLQSDPINSLTYQWDERNQLSQDSSGVYSFFGACPERSRRDAFGRRESFDDFGNVTSYIYDTLLSIQTSSTTTPASSQNFFTSPGGDVLAYQGTSGATTNTFVPMTNVLGSTIGLVNSSGSIATSWKYEPFGVPTMSGASSKYQYLFAGIEYDPTGLYHTWARYYHPRLQRFISEDPLQFGGGQLDLFTYAANDPVNLTDPQGVF